MSTENANIVLIIDDDRNISNVLQSFLAKRGFNVIAAYTGSDAIDFFKEHNSTVSEVILDLGLPDLPGFDVAATLRDIKPMINLTFISGNINDVLNSTNRQKFDAAILQKPFRLTELLTIFEERN